MTGRKFCRIWTIVYSIVLTAFTAWILSDTFIIPDDVVEMPEQAEETGVDNTQAGAVVTDTSYKDDNISITITTKRYKDTNVYIADVVLSDASYLKAGLAQNKFGRNIKATTSDTAEQCNAILAVNGDYYGYRDYGYVMRNGYLYRTVRGYEKINEDLVIYDDGDFEIADESAVTAEEIEAKGAVQIFSFGPGLVNNGVKTVDEDYEVTQSMLSNPRCAIGMIEPLHYVFVVSDGRTDESKGLGLSDLAQVMLDAGCTVAYNLDGGGSATMWFMGKVINYPTTDGEYHERRVSDIVYIGE